MTDELLSYYNRELAELRKLGAEFAEANPKIAGRLGLGADAVEDPHVARLVEAFAYLTARIHRKLDDDFPEISDALLDTLYPHYLRPVPSMAIVQFEPEAELTAGYPLPRGTALETEPVNGRPCRFETCYGLTLWPIRISGAQLMPRPFVAPQLPEGRGALAVLRLSLQCLAEDNTFARLCPDRLRFYLAGSGPEASALYQLLLNDAIAIALASEPKSIEWINLGTQALQPVGFGEGEGLLPYPAQSFVGYRLLTELFAFPEKFRFLELSGLGSERLAGAGGTIELYIYLRRSDPELEHSVSRASLQLGCTPVVNLFKQRAEPIQLDHEQFEYRVVPDARRPLAHEVYSIERVVGTDNRGHRVEYQPLHGGPLRGAAAGGYWHAQRRPAGHRESGTEVFLSLVDQERGQAAPDDSVLSVELTCLNRDLPARLPFGGGQPRLQLAGGSAPITSLRCLTRPSPTHRPPLGAGARWRLISHLVLNHLSLGQGEAGVAALKELLRLYDYKDSPESRDAIEGLIDLSSRPVNGRVPGGGPGVVCRGTEVTIQLDPGRYTGGGLYLFASVIERFLGLYSAINSFTRLIATVKGQEGKLRAWPARAGDRSLL